MVPELKETALEISDLERKIDELIKLCDEFAQKQANLEAHRDNLLQERTCLLGKNELAKSKIEAMITRLKALSQD